MNQDKIDFKTLSAVLLSRVRELMPNWLPGGKIHSSEYRCGSLGGEQGKSFGVNLNTGKWADFATGEKGGDLVSLYAKINGLSNGEAARLLANQYGVGPQVLPDKLETVFIRPPKGTPVPSFKHPDYGDPSNRWTYKDTEGRTLFFICRYNYEGNKKHFQPYSFTSDQKWVRRAWPSPRPIYGLEFLNEDPNRQILIVEGEKSADAARQIVGRAYFVVTWPNGSKAFDKVDWSPIYGRKLLFWPDCDQPGREAMAGLMGYLYPHVPEMKIINVEDKPDGWDAADAHADGMDFSTFREWALPLVTQTKPLPESEQIVKLPQPVFAEVVPFTPEQEESTRREINIHVSTDSSPRNPSVNLAASYDRLDLKTTKSGTAHCTLDNCYQVMDRWEIFKDLVWYDTFHNKIFTKWNTGEVREWSKADTLKLQRHLQRELEMFKVSGTMVEDAIYLYSMNFKRNEPKEWMESLVWDQTPRIDTIFSRVFGATESDYSRAIGRNWMIAMAARIYKPGCKVDNMVILEGSQGKYKSTALNQLAGKWYVEINEPPTSKDFYLAFQGKLIVEIGELDSFNRSEVTTIKKVITCATDRFRPPYGKLSEDFPRQSVLVGTTNEEEYLKDHTGGRRFWPIRTGSIDIQYITDNRDQLFAEAVHRFKQGETWWEVPSDEAKAEQESRRQQDSWEELISYYLLGKSEVTVNQIAFECLKFEANRLDYVTQRRIGKILRALGLKVRPKKYNGVVHKVFFKEGYEPSSQDSVTEQPMLISTKPRNYAPGADNSHLDLSADQHSTTSDGDSSDFF